MGKIVSGEYTGKSGAVKHIMRGNLWIHSNNHLKNSGIMVIRGRECLLAGGAGGGSATNKAVSTALGTSGANVQVPGMAGAQIKTFNLTSGGTGGGGGGFSKDPAIGKTLKVIKGSYKGLLAQCVGVTPTQYSIELLARVKRMMIDKAKCKIVGDKNGSYVQGSFGSTTTTGGMAGADASGRSRGPELAGPMADISTPFLTADTPMHMGAETPLHSGNETPLHGDATPARVDDIFTVTDRDKEAQQRKEQEATRASAAAAAAAAVGATTSF